MKILLIEPFYGGSHKKWADNLKLIFKGDLDLLTLPAKYWKWRMEGSAWKLAGRYLDLKVHYDIILFSELINLSLFISLSEVDRKRTKLYLYMHENQINYPWNEQDEDVQKGRDRHYGFMNIMNALVADKVIYNSSFHKTLFLGSLEKYLKPFPDGKVKIDLPSLHEKSIVIPIPLQLEFLIEQAKVETNNPPRILWNHRWEYDKNPELFFNTLKSIKEKGIEFKLIVLGEKFKRYPEIFELSKDWFKEEIEHFGYCEEVSDYYKLLQSCDFLPVCSNHDFFGISVVEAIAAGCIPLLPQRLAYPEHISPNDYPEIFYSSDKQFELRLIGMIQKKPSLNFQSEMSKYELSRLTPVYKSAFE